MSKQDGKHFVKGVCIICGGPTWDRSALRCKRCYIAVLRQQTGSANREWGNLKSSKKAQGWDRAKRRFQLGACEVCGKPARDRHHRDDNPLNNGKANVMILCRRCHMQIDGRLAEIRQFRARQLGRASKIGGAL